MAMDPSQLWPGSDDRRVVKEMLNDPNSPHWEKCRNCIASYLQKSGVPAEYLDDIIQNTVMSVMPGLKNFRFECRLTAWLQTIARNRKIDWYRDKAREKPPNGRVDSLTEIDAEGEAKASEAVPTTEEIYLRDETSREVRAALEEYARLQKNPERIRNIFQRALYEDDTQKDIAESHNISSARVSQIIGGGFSYVRKKVGRGPDFDLPAPPKTSP